MTASDTGTGGGADSKVDGFTELLRGGLEAAEPFVEIVLGVRVRDAKQPVVDLPVGHVLGNLGPVAGPHLGRVDVLVDCDVQVHAAYRNRNARCRSRMQNTPTPLAEMFSA